MTAEPVNVKWPEPRTTRVPLGLMSDPAIHALEQQKIFQGETWHYLCLEAEIPEPGVYKTTAIGATPIVVTRDEQGQIHALINRCKHKGALVCVEPCGKVKTLRCLYHGWSYDLSGKLRFVPFEKGVQNKGGMPETFDKSAHGLTALRTTCLHGVVFGTHSATVAELADYLGPAMLAHFKRIFHKPVEILGYYHQVMHNNWKLYMENARDSYHATILHAFYATFKLNRLTMGGGLTVDHEGWNTMNYSIGASLADGEYEGSGLRSVMADVGLADASLLHNRQEFADGITVAIQSIFPGCVNQQIYNTLALRQAVPLDVDRTELHWTFFGYRDDDAELRQMRLKQANLIGPAGYVSMEDGVIGEYVQRGIAGEGQSANAMLEMGGSDIASVTDSRANETTVRGFWQAYRSLMGL
ncbi:MAG: Rieske 2Fe-2S domain-containing protein [Pseudomonadales bacterium]|nr:Rieske 2Fe-2S domain-containing protein [Pseudomonadales bacterium]